MMILRSLRGLSGSFLVGVMILVAMLAAIWTPQDPLALNLRARLAAPGGAHLLGTDEFGRDVLSRLMAGASASMTIALTTVVFVPRLFLSRPMCLIAMSTARPSPSLMW